MNDELVALIMGALNEQGDGPGITIAADLGRDTALLGRDGVLDSMGLVALVVAVEQVIEDEYGVSVSLADERALSERKSPFKTVGTLAEYAGRLVEGARRSG
ncbi:MAG: acyl carrier protein [Gaiellales bacterium]